jgi:hypothetical protein
VPLIGVGLVVVIGLVAVVLLTRDDTQGPPAQGPPADASDATSPAVSSFRFTETSRAFVRTSKKRIGRRHRHASIAAATKVQQVLTGLYEEGFFDPTNRAEGSYTDAFQGFSRGARDRAKARMALFTAGDRFEQIELRRARIATRILLDRLGAPVLLVSTVQFSAHASGDDTVLLRSTGQFLFERVGPTWKIVSFRVDRDDRPREAA